MSRWFVLMAIASLAICVVYCQKGRKNSVRQVPEPMKAVVKVQGNGVEGTIFFDCSVSYDLLIFL